jgi:cytochrome P450
LMKPMPVGCLF